MKSLSIICFACCFSVVSFVSGALQEPTSHQELLQKVQQYRAEEAQRIAQREARFLANQAEQQRLLDEAKEAFLALQQQNNPLQKETDSMAEQILSLQQQIEKRQQEIGDIGSLVKQFTQDVSVNIQHSPSALQMRERVEQLQTQESERVWTDLDRLEVLWLALQEEMTLSSEVQNFEAPVIGLDGQVRQENVLRIGSFAMISDERLLRYVPETQELLHVMDTSSQFNGPQNYYSDNGVTYATLDPSGGQLLGLLIHTPSWYDRLEQGGVIGKIIVVLGMLGALIIVWRTLFLTLQTWRMERQLKTLSLPVKNNALGRILIQLTATKVTLSDPEILQLKLEEALVNEVAVLERGHQLLKLLAAIAPLLGLLGTVTGMILTFQSISLFGSGDPKMMAGGISQALITTVLGLLVAIPLLFGHSFISSLSDRLLQRLDEQSAGILARFLETSPSQPNAIQGKVS